MIVDPVPLAAAFTSSDNSDLESDDEEDLPCQYYCKSVKTWGEWLTAVMEDSPVPVTDEQRKEMEEQLKAGGPAALKGIFDKALEKYRCLYSAKRGSIFDSDSDGDEAQSSSENEQQEFTNDESPETNDGGAELVVQQQQTPDVVVVNHDWNADGARDVAVDANGTEVITLSDSDDENSGGATSVCMDELQITFEKHVNHQEDVVYLSSDDEPSTEDPGFKPSNQPQCIDIADEDSDCSEVSLEANVGEPLRTPLRMVLRSQFINSTL